MRNHDLIAAPATPAGKGAVGIVRLSGLGVDDVIRAMVGGPLQPRIATLCSFHDADASVIDRGLALYFPPGHSYTGEAMLELQGHGGPMVQHMLLRRCLGLGARLAHPGEFTERAFLNNRMDLAQAEAVADLIEAQTEVAARTALRSLQGEFSARVRHCVERLIELRALTESSMDFPEEGIELVSDEMLRGRHLELLMALRDLQEAAQRGNRLREGAVVVIAGRPNVGKSSLLNRLVEDDVAIVSDVPGTTRDVVRDRISIGGLAIELLDTAGLRESEDPLERLGMDRTRKALEVADLILHVLESDDSDCESEGFPGRRVLRVVNKIDTTGRLPGVARAEEGITVYLSARTGAGLDVLKEAVQELLGGSHSEEGTFLARERHLVALREACTSLERAGSRLAERELFAEELRMAQQFLAGITGEFSSDDLLGHIFSKFCIGK